MRSGETTEQRDRAVLEVYLEVASVMSRAGADTDLLRVDIARIILEEADETSSRDADGQLDARRLRIKAICVVFDQSARRLSAGLIH